MTPRQIELVQTTWESVIPISETAAGLFYNRLFELDPALRPMFTTDIKEQGAKLMQMITIAVRGLHNIEALVPAVEQLGRRHAGYGVRDKDYGTVASALLWTLEQGLGPAFTPETREAWATIYGVLATTMQSATAAQSAA